MNEKRTNIGCENIKRNKEKQWLKIIGIICEKERRWMRKEQISDLKI